VVRVNLHFIILGNKILPNNTEGTDGMKQTKKTDSERNSKLPAKQMQLIPYIVNTETTFEK
jgi:hypothetical protein